MATASTTTSYGNVFVSTHASGSDGDSWESALVTCTGDAHTIEVTFYNGTVREHNLINGSSHTVKPEDGAMGAYGWRIDKIRAKASSGTGTVTANRVS